MPRVSVIIPNYNHAKYLRQRIESVLAQTYHDFDLLLMDDCSTDASRDILKEYSQHPRVTLMLNQKNSGSTFKQWNKGVAAVAGEYIWLAESDDYADPRLLETLVATLDQHENVGIAFCQSYVVDEHNSILRTTHDDHLIIAPPDRWRSDFVADGRRECAQYLFRQNIIPNASAAVFRRDLFNAVHGADESFRLCGDWKLWVSILLRSDIANIAAPLNYYRTHTQNVRTETKGAIAQAESLRVMRVIRDNARVDPKMLEGTYVWIAQGLINSWLNHTLPPKPACRQLMREVLMFDRSFRGRVACIVLVRMWKVLISGKAMYWARSLFIKQKH